MECFFRKTLVSKWRKGFLASGVNVWGLFVILVFFFSILFCKVFGFLLFLIRLYISCYVLVHL